MGLQLTHSSCSGVPKSGDDKTEKTMNMQNIEDFSIHFAPYVMQAKDYYITLSLADVMKDLLSRHNVLKATKDKVLNYSWWTRTTHYSGEEEKRQNYPKSHISCRKQLNGV